MSRSRQYRVRFAPSTTVNGPLADRIPTAVNDQTPSRSRTACYGCRMRHIKCDEKFPVCTRCHAKNLVCMPRGPQTLWQLQVPWLQSSVVASQPAVNRRLLELWLGNVCQVMTLDPDDNPLSFPLLNQLSESKALVHALQSVTAGHELYYISCSNTESIEERGKALYMIRQEISAPTAIRIHSFLAVWILGLSSQWIDQNVGAFGEEHLMAARTILENLLQQKSFPAYHPFRPFIIGSFIWWDMACSFLVDPLRQKALDTPELFVAVKLLRGKFCTLLSHSIELIYHLCFLGRYCRALLDSGIRDLEFEDLIEQELLTWEHLSERESLRILNESFRLHGLVMLYRLCKSGSGIDNEDYIRSCSQAILHNIAQIGTHNPPFKFLSLPLLCAGAELSEKDHELRIQVVKWFGATYSLVHLPTLSWATALLYDLWARRDAGEQVNWLQLMVQKGWTLMLG